jgi:hypothetical protein
MSCRIKEIWHTKLKMKNIHRLALLIWIGVLEGVFPRPALAIQQHGPPEGFYLHQIAHLVFIGSLIFFIYKLAKEVRKHRSFRLLAWACGLLVLLNPDSMMGHQSALPISNLDFIGLEGHLNQRLVMSGPFQWIYYVSSFDNIILVPAAYCFYRGLKALITEPETGKP